MKTNMNYTNRGRWMTHRGMVDWFFDKVLPVFMIGAFLFVFGMIVFSIAMSVVHGDNICDTPMGSRDMRCVGYYARSHR